MSGTGGLPFEHRREVRYHDCGDDLRLSVPAALRWFEEAALLQSEEMGVGFDYYHDQEVAWVLSRWDLRFDVLPDLRETVTVRTVPQSYRAFGANRAYAVLGADGKTCAEGRSQWIFLDRKVMRPTRVPTILGERYGMIASKGRLPWDGDARAPERTDHEASLVVRRGDIDYNGHVNNVRYLEWAFEALPEAHLRSHRIARLTARYQSEVRYGSAVRTIAQVDAKGDAVGTRHAVLEEDRTAAVIELSWLLR